jgi:hypothetical protein
LRGHVDGAKKNKSDEYNKRAWETWGKIHVAPFGKMLPVYGKPMPNVMPLLPKPAAGLGVA